MILELPKILLMSAVGAFLLGWVLASIRSHLHARYKAKKRDPRDDRIRSLEAELRIALSECERVKGRVEGLEKEFNEVTVGLERRDHVISEQQAKLEKVGSDLKESVMKTRELRAELANRATENVHAEAKIREVETELSVAQASTDMIATGVLDYSFAPDKQDSDLSARHGDTDVVSPEVKKANQ